MSDAVKISEAKLDMLRLLLKDPKVRKCIMDGRNAKEVTVGANGTIRLGKYKRSWVNDFFMSYSEIEFFSVAIKIAATITEKDNSNNNNDLVGFIENIVNSYKNVNGAEAIIESLFYYIVLFDQDSIYKSKYITNGGLRSEKGRKESCYGRAEAYIQLGKGGSVIPVTLEIQR